MDDWSNDSIHLDQPISFFSSKPALKNRSTIFTMGNRGSVLSADLEAPIIVPHAAQKSDKKVRWSLSITCHHVRLSVWIYQ